MDGLLLRLAPACERVDLGALELWLPRSEVDAKGKPARAKRPRGWKDVALGALELQERWLDVLGVLATPEGPALRADLAALTDHVRRLPAKGPLESDEEIVQTARRLRIALAGKRWQAHGLVLLVAPGRAHYAALLGAAGIVRPSSRAHLWQPIARRTANQRLTQSALAVALAWGPRDDDGPWDAEFSMQEADARQQTLHAASHLLSSALLPQAPMWFTEGLAVADTVELVGADETLCTGYEGRDRTPFDGWDSVPEAFLAYARLERSPYRGTGSGELFVDQLRQAREEQGFRVLDLDRARVVLVAPGPFLGDEARVPDDVARGPRAVKEGFAEFFRAYCAAFVGWMHAQRDAQGSSLLARTLVELRARGEALRGKPNTELEAAIAAACGRTLGRSRDSQRDLEAAFVAWLGERR